MRSSSFGFVCVLAFLLPVFCATSLVAGQQETQQRPEIGMVDSPSVKVLTGLTAPQFEHEMQEITSSLGVGCGFCHVRGSYSSDNNPHKVTARRMLEMTKMINQQFFPNYKPADGESVLGKVTCYTCHQGNERPKTTTP